MKIIEFVLAFCFRGY